MIFTAGQLFRYFAMPEILPRIKDLFGTGFGHIAFFIAHIYRSARLLPGYHPYLNPVNIGKFGIHHVIAEAAKNIKFKKENSDQIIIFFTILFGLFILTAQFFTLLMGVLFINTAHATGIPLDFFDFFKANQPTDNDVAFVLLDMVFGVPDFFESCVAKGKVCFEKGGNNIISNLPGNNTTTYQAYDDFDRSTSIGAYPFPTPVHEAMRSMMQLYSVGLLVIAMLIFLYFIIAIVAETAQEGTPFGKRFNKVWAPLRMVVALGLLIPIAHGLNSGQYLVLYAAKFGSNFATNGWVLFTDTVVSGTTTLLGEQNDLVAVPRTPEINALVEFFTILATCIRAEKIVNGVTASGSRTINAYHVKPNQGTGPNFEPAFNGFTNALAFYENRDILIVFGAEDVRADGNPVAMSYQGGIAPICGSIVLPVPSVNQGDNPGAWQVTQEYYDLFLTPIWQEASQNTLPAFNLTPVTTPPSTLHGIGSNIVLNLITSAQDFTTVDPTVDYPTIIALQTIVDDYQVAGGGSGFKNIEDILQDGAIETATNGNWLYDLEQLGWGGAGIWFNKLAQLNGAMVAAAYKLPYVKEYPMAMLEVEEQRRNNDASVTGYNRFKPYLSDETDIDNASEGTIGIQKALYQSQVIWKDVYTKPSNNFFIDAIISVFGLEGLFNMVDNTDIHPLAQLVAVGKSLLESSIRNIGFSFAAGVLGVAAQGTVIGPIANVASSFSASIGMIGLGLGFVLFYIIPLLPFIYFFFAVGGWVKGIFEAMVGVPLWALAHIRIDGNGLPGDAAMGGYYLILEIFLRPILIIFGLIASISIFAAQVKILNEIWSLVTTNLSGFDEKATAPAGETGAIEYMRGHVDRLFFTVIYAIIVYLLAMSSFKLVTLIPNNILRWMGANVQTFGDQSEDPAQNLVRNTMIGSQITTGSLGSSFGRLRGAMSGGGG
jgi:conjugal transfer/type IV secretion protein DotA/TraY